MTADIAGPLRYGWLPKDAPGAKIDGGPIGGCV